MNPTIDDDNIELIVILQDRDVLQGIAVYKDAVGIVSTLNLPVAPHQEYSISSGRGDDTLVRGETEQVDEMFKITRIGSVRRPRKAVVTNASQHYTWRR